MTILGMTFVSLVEVFVIALVFSALFIWAGASMAKVKSANFGKSFMAALASSIITWVITALFAGITGIGSIIGFLIGLFLTILVIKTIFKTDWGKALLVWIFHIVAEVLAIIVGSLTFAGTMTLFGG